MAKLLGTEERPDSMKASMILVSYADLKVSESIKRTKAQAKVRADSILTILKKTPDRFVELAKTISDYPTAKDDGGDLKWFVDGNANFSLFFKTGLGMKPGEVKLIETGLGYTLLKLTEKTKPLKKVQVAVLQRQIAPSNQTYQDIYQKASAFAGQNKTPEAFEKAAAQKGLAKRSAQSVKVMDNSLQGITSTRAVIRWAYGKDEKVGEVKIGDVSPVYTISDKYIVAILKNITPKGFIPLAQIKDRIQQAVKNEVKARMLNEKLGKAFMTNKDLYSLAAELKSKVDTTRLTFAGYSSSALGRENEILGQLFTMKKGVVTGPLEGKYGAYLVIVDELKEPPAKTDFTNERNTMVQSFSQRVMGAAYEALKKTATIKDDRVRFY
jgi:peptidyl-prolyl cis-trans isomerase D